MTLPKRATTVAAQGVRTTVTSTPTGMTGWPGLKTVGAGSWGAACTEGSGATGAGLRA
jgi:hypothetical protein